MRAIRLAFVILLAIILIGIAMANRGMVMISLFPANFGQYLGGTWSLTMPIFLALFLAILFGVLVGFIWEWLRESAIRADANRKAAEVQRLEREVAHLRNQHAAPRDEILAIVDGPVRAANPNTVPHPAALPPARN